MLRFTKMQGIGNDFVMVDTLRDALPQTEITALAKIVNDRKFGIGGDGLILIEKGSQAPYRMRMFNPDGSESEMCGNGIRCFAKLLKDHGHLSEPTVDVETGAGTLHLEITAGGMVKVNMGKARLTRGEIGMLGNPSETFQNVSVESMAGTLQGTAVGMGNPHLVLFVADAMSIPLEIVGPELEFHPQFPNRTNVHFVQVLDRNTILQRTWERGAGATLACGTGACASAVAAAITGRAENSVEVQLPGGSLWIDYLESGEVMMTGPAETVFEGDFSSI
jgi:diaminopimelate epimerase